jgi:dihydrofolate reductase
MKLTSTTLVSVDGVMQAPGGSEEDRRDGFQRGGWARGRPDAEVAEFISEIYAGADAFLFGRWTFELFAGYWGVNAAGSHPIGDALNSRPKYVASTTLSDPQWAPTTVLTGDLAAAIGELRAAPGRELQVPGSCTLVRWLLANGLLDELRLLTVPILVGAGMRLFPEEGPDIRLELLDSRAFPKGTMLQVYRPAGRPHYATSDAG